MRGLAETKAKYREVKRRFNRNDSRVRKEIFAKYGKRQADEIQSEIHKITKRIVKYAVKNDLAIALQNIKGIRKLYRKGNGQGKQYRARLNSWSFGEFQRQVDYKARLNGHTVIYVNARSTSSKCAVCGDKLFPEERRLLRCISCSRIVDRDENAAINIRNRGLEKLFSMRFSPIGEKCEAMVVERDDYSTPQVDFSQITRK